MVRARRGGLAAACMALSVFSCSYGDREDREEDAKATRAAVVPPPSRLGVGGAARTAAAYREGPACDSESTGTGVPVVPPC
jgi:hypothetical protein